MKKIRLLNRLGQGMTEYIIIVALIAIAAIAAFTYFGNTVRSQVGGIASELSGQDAATSIGDAQSAAGKVVTEGTEAKGLGAYNNNQTGP